MKLPALLLLFIKLPVMFCSEHQVFTATPEQTDNETEVEQVNCSYQDVLNHLQLKKNQDLFTLSRPVRHYKTATEVRLLVLIYAILDVREIDQTFISYLWMTMYWQNDFIRWKPRDFCGITSVSVPTETLWKPDLTIEEMTEKDKSTPSPFMEIRYDGYVIYNNDQVVVSTCQMHVHNFPFDVQQCNLSFRSIMFPESQMKLSPILNSADSTDWTRDVMRTQYEWVFLNMTVTKSSTVDIDGYVQDILIVSINMRRRSLLYVVNFLFPVLFFLLLDLASFLMSDTGGEKLGFKITLLLAVTVMQLLLNDILPASSKRIPLIAVFCLGIFSLMLVSLLESILVLYLINKDQEQSDPYRPLEDVITSSRDVVPSKSTLEKDLHGLTALLTEFLQKQKEDEGPGYWSRKAPLINRVFVACYITAAALFLGILFYHWTAFE